MPRKPRQISPAGVYHFISRGVNKKHLFHCRDDYEYYLCLLKEYSERLAIKIYHYCLMPNHTHLLIQVDDVTSLSRFGHFVQRRYAYYYCKNHHWSEQVFRKRFISLPVEDDQYLLECGRYIERNPLKTKLCSDPKDYPYTSYSFYGHNKPNVLITSSPAYLGLSPRQEERAVIYQNYVMQPRIQEMELVSAF